MKSLTYIISIILFMILTSCSDVVDGNGKVIEKVVEISDYENLKIAGNPEIVYSQKQDTLPYLRIEIDENLFPLLEIESENGELSIKSVDGKSINPTKFTITTNSKELASLNIAGSLSVHLTGNIISDSFTIKSAGSSTLRADSIISNIIEIKSAGSERMTLLGVTETINCKVSGSADLDMLNLKADNVKCSISGSANILTHVENKLEANISGSSKISYKGTPEITKNVSGSGDVISLN